MLIPLEVQKDLISLFLQGLVKHSVLSKLKIIITIICPDSPSMKAVYTWLRCCQLLAELASVLSVWFGSASHRLSNHIVVSLHINQSSMMQSEGEENREERGERGWHTEKEQGGSRDMVEGGVNQKRGHRLSKDMEEGRWEKRGGEEEGNREERVGDI